MRWDDGREERNFAFKWIIPPPQGEWRNRVCRLKRLYLIIIHLQSTILVTLFASARITETRLQCLSWPKRALLGTTRLRSVTVTVITLKQDYGIILLWVAPKFLVHVFYTVINYKLFHQRYFQKTHQLARTRHSCPSNEVMMEERGGS